MLADTVSLGQTTLNTICNVLLISSFLSQMPPGFKGGKRHRSTILGMWCSIVACASQWPSEALRVDQDEGLLTFTRLFTRRGIVAFAGEATLLRRSLLILRAPNNNITCGAAWTSMSHRALNFRRLTYYRYRVSVTCQLICSPRSMSRPLDMLAFKSQKCLHYTRGGV